MQKEQLSKNEIIKSHLKIASAFLDTILSVLSSNQFSAGDKDVRPYGPKIWNLLPIQIKSWKNLEICRYHAGKYHKKGILFFVTEDFLKLTAKNLISKFARLVFYSFHLEITQKITFVYI